MGGRPITALALLCFPDAELSPEVLREILRGGQDKMTEAGVSLLGGHSVRDPELKFGYSVTGVVQIRHLLTNAGARPGDRLLLTKPLGTGILATALKQQQLERSTLTRLTRQMTTLNRRASVAAVEFEARAVTDVTGFGLLGHASQLADASGVTLTLRPARSWFLPRTLDFAAAGVGPGGLAKNREHYATSVEPGATPEPMLRALYDPQTSGGLLISVPPRRAKALVTALKRGRSWVTEIGDVVKRGSKSVELVWESSK
jgi:selenide,water dikinase